MEPTRHIRLLQLTYAAQLADSVLQYERHGILEQVADERRAERFAAGAAQAARLGVTEPAGAFTTSAELFGCADWTIAAADDVPGSAAASQEAGDEPVPAFTATARACALCALVKKAGGPSPCRLFCLDPVESMVKGLAPGAAFAVEETLYDGDECRVSVR